MKSCLVVLVFVFAGQFNAQKTYYDEKQGKDQELIYKNGNIERIYKINEYYNNEGKQYEEDEYDDDPGNPDKRAIIVRPCAFFDRFCIRKFLAEHSNCKIVPGPIVEPYFVQQSPLYITQSNITATLTNIELSGFNGRIDEFYINKVTGNLVLSVFFEGIKLLLKPVYFRFNRNGQEPVERIADAAIDYLKFTVTIVIPNYSNLKLEDSEVNGYLDDPFPPFVIGPNVLKSTDPTVVEEVAALLADIPSAAIENLATIAPLVAKIFVQRSLCDFGVPISKL